MGIIIISGLILIVVYRLYRLLRANFWRRGMESSGFFDYFMAHHPEVVYSRLTCECDNGRRYLGGILLRPECRAKGLIVMTHGYGRTLEHYLPEGCYFVKNGFMVLLFDGRGFGMSSGKWMWGLPQHVLDMRQILRYVQQDKDLSAYPLFLYGHSWGGYAANAVSCLEGFPVRGLISVAAYNDALAVVRHVSRWRYGRLSSLVIMLFEIYQRIFFGRMSRMTSAQGLQKLTCPMLICHSQDDAIVPYTENFSVIRQRLKGQENVLFMDMNGRNHNITTPPEIDVRQRALIRRLKEQDSEEAKEELWKLQMITDEELMLQFVQFLNTCGTD